MGQEWILGSDECQYNYHQFGPTCTDRQWDIFHDVQMLFLGAAYLGSCLLMDQAGDSLIQIEFQALMEVISGDRHMGAYPASMRSELETQGCADNLAGSHAGCGSYADWRVCR